MLPFQAECDSEVRQLRSETRGTRKRTSFEREKAQRRKLEERGTMGPQRSQLRSACACCSRSEPKGKTTSRRLRHTCFRSRAMVSYAHQGSHIKPHTFAVLLHVCTGTKRVAH